MRVVATLGVICFFFTRIIVNGGFCFAENYRPRLRQKPFCPLHPYLCRYTIRALHTQQS